MSDAKSNHNVDVIVILAVLTSIILAVCMFIIPNIISNHHGIGSSVPCNNYVQVTQKYKSLDESGVMHFNLILSDGTKSEISGWPTQGDNEASWDEIPFNTTGYLVKMHLGYNDYDTISFSPQNITVASNEGENFCTVIP